MVSFKSVSDIIQEISPYYKARTEEKNKGKRDYVAEQEHKLIYDSTTETLEPIYFFILDLMKDFGFQTEKLIDNFVSSSGSQHFGEMGQRSSIMQQQGSKLMGDINTVLRSILNLIYDLREFKIRMENYKDLENPKKKDAAILSLKQIWMDKVDIQKGNSSIKAMAMSQGGFVTLIDGFLAAKDENEVEKMDLNQIVKRILKSRIYEFNVWLKESGAELEKRYKLERTYLKSQVNALKIYSRWAKPYMRAAQELEMSESGKRPELVKMFNTLILELSLMGKRKVSLDYPHKYKQKREYYSVVLIDFFFRGIPSRSQQGYVMGGRAEVTFRSYSLNEEELKKLDHELEKSDLGSALSFIEGATTESLGELQEDINYYLEEEKKEKGESKKVFLSTDKSNPFKALIGGYDEGGSPFKGIFSKPKKVDAKKFDPSKDEIKKDDWIEKNYLRNVAAEGALQSAFKFFDIYKKAHQMASYTQFPQKDFV